MNRNINVKQLRDFFKNSDDHILKEWLDDGLRDFIENYEQEDYFGTEGFNKRFA